MRRDETGQRRKHAHKKPTILCPHPQPPSTAPAPAAAAAPGPRFKVALLGASGGIGQPLGLLLKL